MATSRSGSDSTSGKSVAGARRRPSTSFVVILVVAIVVAGAALWFLLWSPEPVGAPGSEDMSKQAENVDTEPDGTSAVDCGTRRYFHDADMGLEFCYPDYWGMTSVSDARLASSDTGHRQRVTFSDQPFVFVGGVSDDWTTTVGRDGMCSDPSNHMPALSEYNTDWHDVMGEGDDVSFATRSVIVSAGGYAITEEVSNVLQSGVCARGYKVLHGSRYRVGSASFYRDFAEASGITSPALHMAHSDVLFSPQQRTEFDALMASLGAYSP